MAFRGGVGMGLALALALAGSASAGIHRYYYDAIGRLLGATSTNNWQRTGRSDNADNATYLNVLETVSPTGVDTLSAGGALIAEQTLTSSDGQCTLTLQTNGNLVITQGTSTPWSSGTSGNLPGYLYLNGSGQLYLYGPDNTTLWTSNNTASPGATAVLSDINSSCVLSIVPAGGGAPVWSS